MQENGKLHRCESKISYWYCAFDTAGVSVSTSFQKVGIEEMKHIIEFNRDELRIDKKIMKFGYDIRDIKVVDNQVIVLLSIPFHTNEIDNICGILRL